MSPPPKPTIRHSSSASFQRFNQNHVGYFRPHRQPLDDADHQVNHPQTPFSFPSSSSSPSSSRRRQQYHSHRKPHNLRHSVSSIDFNDTRNAVTSPDDDHDDHNLGRPFDDELPDLLPSPTEANTENQDVFVTPLTPLVRKLAKQSRRYKNSQSNIPITTTNNNSNSDYSSPSNINSSTSTPNSHTTSTHVTTLKSPTFDINNTSNYNNSTNMVPTPLKSAHLDKNELAQRLGDLAARLAQTPDVNISHINAQIDDMERSFSSASITTTPSPSPGRILNRRHHEPTTESQTPTPAYRVRPIGPFHSHSFSVGTTPLSALRTTPKTTRPNSLDMGGSLFTPVPVVHDLNSLPWHSQTSPPPPPPPLSSWAPTSRFSDLSNLSRTSNSQQQQQQQHRMSFSSPLHTMPSNFADDSDTDSDTDYDSDQQRYVPIEEMEQVMAESKALNNELQKLVANMHARQEETKHIHGLLVERAERAAQRILFLQGRVGHLEHELQENDSELQHLRLQMKAIEVQCPASDDMDPDLRQSIDNWKRDWTNLKRKRSAAPGGSPATGASPRISDKALYSSPAYTTPVRVKYHRPRSHHHAA